jgi:hypothetical protein
MASFLIWGTGVSKLSLFPAALMDTIVLLDSSNGIVFSGDARNVNTLLSLPRSSLVEGYRESLPHIRLVQEPGRFSNKPCKMLRILPFLSGCCSEAEVSEQFY